MIEISLNPRDLSVPVIVGFLDAVAIACVLNLVSSVAIYRTKNTPYATRLLSLAMLYCHISFLILSGCSKLIAFKEFDVFKHLTRGFHISAQCIVCGMAVERFLLIHKPYKYLKVTKKRTKIICSSVAMISLLQYMLVRGLGCYARGLFVTCGMFMKIYYVGIVVILSLVSYVCYCSVFRITCRKNREITVIEHHLLSHKGTMASATYLISTTINAVAYLGLAISKVKMTIDGIQTDLNLLVDSVGIVNCYIDPFIYIIWFRETRMELLKLIHVCCPRLQPKIEMMRIEIFNIQISSIKETTTVI